MKKLLTLSIILVSAALLKAQDCEVSLPELKGEYTGECKNGKAEGIGTATGKEDSYGGQFKKGKPHGRGTWTWKDGHRYMGEWKDGNMDGTGEMYYTNMNGADSMIPVVYTKGKPIAETNEPYKIHFAAANIARIKVEKTNVADQIVIEMESTSGGIVAIHGSLPIPVLSDLEIIKGMYNQVTGTTTAKRSITRILQPTFPLRLRFKAGGQNVDIAFTEPSGYKVSIQIN